MRLRIVPEPAKLAVNAKGVSRTQTAQIRRTYEPARLVAAFACSAGYNGGCLFSVRKGLSAAASALATSTPPAFGKLGKSTRKKNKKKTMLFS